jgi:ABC-type glycerol-3-phosphate transport system substrate-binding protein
MLASYKRLLIPRVKKHQNFRLLVVMVFTFLMCIPFTQITHSQYAISPEAKEQLLAGKGDIAFINPRDLLEPFYSIVLKNWQEQGLKEVEDFFLEIKAWDFVDYGYDPKYATDPKWEVVTGLGDRNIEALVWDQEETWLVWEFEVPEAGLYNIAIEYIPLQGQAGKIQRDIKINGKYPFNEAMRIIFPRTFIYTSNTPIQDNQGNDTRSKQQELHRWSTIKLQDADGLYRYPFLFYFNEGVNRIEMKAIRYSMAISSIYITSPEYVKSYAEVKKEYEALGYKPVENTLVKFQTEHPLYRAENTVRAETGWDPSAEPAPLGNYRLNEFGGWRWRSGLQYVTWKFEVPEDGLYKIGFKAYQGWSEKIPSTRAIMIDGQFPAKEWEEVIIDYDYQWKMVVPKAENGEEMLVYLTKGEHTLTMTPTVGPLRNTVNVLRENSETINRISREITMITGADPDVNFDYKIHLTIPTLIPRLQAVVDSFREEARFVREVAGEGPRLADQMEMTATIFQDMIKRPETITRRLEEFATQEQALSSWTLRLQEAPLTLDYIIIASPDTVFPSVLAGPTERLRAGIDSFINSFKNDYTGIGDIYEEDPDENATPVLNIWVGRGREWAMITKDMIEEHFTPETGIKVNVNVIPTGQAGLGNQLNVVLMAAATGNVPDLVIGSNNQLPVEFAIRGGVVDLSSFPDYPEVASRFRPGALIPFRYTDPDGNTGNYALPETQDFNMIFARTDILGTIGMEVPQTWDDVLAMLPTLQQLGMNFYYDSNPGGFTSILYQHGGQYYTDDNSYSALDSPEALKAFTLWTSLFAQYRVPVNANFYNRMRWGIMPIGVANYQTYVLLNTAAPELTGWWTMQPIPGVMQEDGVINRTTNGGAETAVIFKDSENIDLAWEFLKWWTSTEVQQQYGSEVEAYLGAEARWNTANYEALLELPWPKDDIAAISEQWQWLREVPIIPGAYYTSRHVTNAWNRTVLQGMNPREALEIAVKDIDRELRKKREEFGFDVDESDPKTRSFLE